MSTPLETAVIALGVNGALTTGALVYVVRRVTPWPKLPAPPQAPGLPRRGGPGGTAKAARGPGSEEEAAGIAAITAAGRRAWDITHPQGADGTVPPGGAG
jgi:hypothetical protein